MKANITGIRNIIEGLQYILNNNNYSIQTEWNNIGN